MSYDLENAHKRSIHHRAEIEASATCGCFYCGHVFAPGAAVASQRTGAWIVPIRAAASSAWRLKSWDRFLIPKPFSRVDVRYGKLTVVEAASPRDAAEQAPRLQALLEAVPGS